MFLMVIIELTYSEYNKPFRLEDALGQTGTILRASSFAIANELFLHCQLFSHWTSKVDIIAEHNSLHSLQLYPSSRVAFALPYLATPSIA